MIYHGGSGDSDSYDLTDLPKEVRRTCVDLRKHAETFDVIAVTGLSGILPAVPVSLRLKVPFAILRKPSDDTHQLGGAYFKPRDGRRGSHWVNGEQVQGKRVLWLDDFACTGDTRTRINEAVVQLGGEVVAEYLTRDREFTPWLDGKPDWTTYDTTFDIVSERQS